MKVSGFVAGVIILIFCMTGSTSGLKCYDCHETNFALCSKSKTIDCGTASGKPTCSKIVGSVNGGGESRLCDTGIRGTPTIGCSKDNGVESCFCDSGDFCNGSDGLSGSFFWSLGLVTVTTILNLV